LWNERPRSIRARLALRIVIGGGALLALLFSALDLLIDYQLHSRFDEALTARGRQMATDIAGGAGIEQSAHHGWPEFRAGNHTDYYQLWDTSGAAVARSASSGDQDLARPPRPVDDEAVLYDVQLPDGHRGRAAAFQLAGGQLFVIASEREALDLLESRIHVALVATVSIALLLMVTLSHAAVRAGLQPLEAFGQRAAARALNPEAPATRDASLPDELRPIGAALDNAFAELTRALLRERRFARDLAHELRTPLAELFSLLETTQAADDASRARLTLAGSTLTGMTRIVDGLLALARYEAGIDAPVVEPVDVAATVRTQCRAAETRALGRDIALDVQLDPELWIMTDALLIERILANLLGNAIDHSPDGDRIEVFCWSQEESVTLVISNAAPALEAADVARLGERHFRPARGAPGGTHAGLGLALCAALAEQIDIRLAFDLHEGRLWVKLGGLRTLESAL
jgi:signal transduction histidine kinase